MEPLKGYSITIELTNGHNRTFYFDNLFDADTCFNALKFANYSTGEFNVIQSEVTWDNGKITNTTVLREL